MPHSMAWPLHWAPNKAQIISKDAAMTVGASAENIKNWPDVLKLYAAIITQMEFMRVTQPREAAICITHLQQAALMTQWVIDRHGDKVLP